jgi:hypothetical protein
LVESTRVANRFDFGCAAFSADLNARAIRVMFPTQGARRVRVVHRDAPNAFWQIAKEIGPEYNILTTRLSAGGAGEKTNTIFAVCEPSSPLNPQHLEASAMELAKKLNALASPNGPAVKIEVDPPMPFQRTLMPEKIKTVETLLEGLEALLGLPDRQVSDEVAARLINIAAKTMRGSPEYVQRNASAITLELGPNVLTALGKAKDERAPQVRATVIRALAPDRSYVNKFIQRLESGASRSKLEKMTVFLAVSGSVDKRALEQARAVLTLGNRDIHEAHLLADINAARSELDFCDACCLVIGNPGNSDDDGRFSFLDVLSLAQDCRDHIPTLIAFDMNVFKLPLSPIARNNVELSGFDPKAAKPPPTGVASQQPHLDSFFKSFLKARSLPAVVTEWTQQTTVLRLSDDSTMGPLVSD